MMCCLSFHNLSIQAFNQYRCFPYFVKSLIAFSTHLIGRHFKDSLISLLRHRIFFQSLIEICQLFFLNVSGVTYCGLLIYFLSLLKFCGLLLSFWVILFATINSLIDCLLTLLDGITKLFKSLVLSKKVWSKIENAVSHLGRKENKIIILSLFLKFWVETHQL